MPGTGRLIVPCTSHHLVQRGHNRPSVFAEPGDYSYCLETLGEFKAEFGIKVYAYCLMTNHVHLIVEPGQDSASRRPTWRAKKASSVAGRYMTDAAETADEACRSGGGVSISLLFAPPPSCRRIAARIRQ